MGCGPGHNRAHESSEDHSMHGSDTSFHVSPVVTKEVINGAASKNVKEDIVKEDNVKGDASENEQQQARSFTHYWRGKKPTMKHLKHLQCLNLRDVGATVPDAMRAGRVFRSSELLSGEDMKRFGIKTILDLRRMDRPCKKKGRKIDKIRLVLRYARKGPRIVVSERLKPYQARGQPHPCEVCRRRVQDKLGFEPGSVVHADLIPSLVGLRIFQAMPTRVKAKALLAAVTGRGAASVMAPAVANPLYMGYRALYKTILEDSKRGVAKAIRVFADKDNYPVLIHCIHGKDRTGIIVMLLLMLCNVNPEVIVEDYMMSEAVLKQSRMHHELDLDVYLTTDDVIAATRDTMEDTIHYLNDNYGGAASYLHEAGLEDWELSRIRVNLLQRADAQDLLERLSLLSPLPGSPRKSKGKFEKMFSPRAARTNPSIQRVMSNPEGQSLPSVSDIRAEADRSSTIAAPSSASTASSGSAAAGNLRGSSPPGDKLFATMSAPPLVDRFVAHPNDACPGKASVHSSIKNEPPERGHNGDSGEGSASEEKAADKASARAQLVNSTQEPPMETKDMPRREDDFSSAIVPDPVKPFDVRKSVGVFEDKRTSLKADEASPISREC